jgi:acetyltransferase-like isoleucine patch superfamily enzyme
MSFIDRLSKRAPWYLLPYEITLSFLRFFKMQISLASYKLYGVNIHTTAKLGHGHKFVYPWNITISDKCILGNHLRLWSEDSNSKLFLSSGVEIARDCVLDFTGGITIENGVLISEGCIIYTHDHGYDPHSAPVANTLVIERGAWIGARVIILPSVRRIGANSIIGAGAVVTKDVPDNYVFVGAVGRLIPKKKVT